MPYGRPLIVSAILLVGMEASGSDPYEIEKGQEILARIADGLESLDGTVARRAESSLLGAPVTWLIEVENASAAAREVFRRRVLPALFRRLREQPCSVGAAVALGHLAPLAVGPVAELQVLLKSPSVDVRLAAIECLSEGGPSATVAAKALASLLHGRDPRVRVPAARAMATMGQAGISELIAALSRSDGEQAAALHGLSRTHDLSDSQVLGLGPLMRHSDHRVRRLAAAAIAASARPGLSAATRASLERILVTALEDDEHVRASAIVGLGRLNELASGTRRRLLEFARSPERVRVVAIEALAEAGAEADMVPVLAQLLGDDLDRVRIAAAKSLGALGGSARAAEAAVRKQLRVEESENARGALTEALRAIGAE